MPRVSTDEEFIAAWSELGSPKLVAEKLGVSARSVMERRRTIEARHKITLNTTQDLRLVGRSTLLGPDGQIKLQWVKTGQGQPTPEEWQDIVKDVFADSQPVRRIPTPKTCNHDLLTVYPIGDHHVAMYSWGAETGQDYDTHIAEKLLVSAVSHLVDLAPPSEVAIIANVGDFFHVDQHRPETTRSRNALDVDTRYAAMIHAGVAMLRTCIEHALVKHKRVKVINACGNHDDVGALWLSLALSLLYEKNPRVEIETSPAKFAYHRHGKVLLGVTHGDTAKLDKLASVMAADQHEMWGATTHRYWITGHIHQRKVLEQPGCMVESFRTLAARDAWSTAAGYRSGRDMTSIVFHKEHGEVCRHRFDVGMLEAR